ncbi:TetR/AcrR family transcriptional regulator [Nocardia sp. NPDC055165]
MKSVDVRRPALASTFEFRGSEAQGRRRAAALVAAQAVFVANGYHGATMDEISTRAGISKPVLYGYFINKLDLYLTVLQRYLDTMVDGVRAGLAADTGRRDRLRRTVLTYFDFVEDDSGGHVLVFEYPVPSEPSVELRVRSAMRQCATLVSAELRAAGVVSVAADSCAWSLVGASHLAARQWLATGRPIAKNDAVDVVVALCWNGLSALDIELASHS